MTRSLARTFRSTHSGRTPLGHFADGTPVFPLTGAAPQDDDSDPGDGDGDDDGDPDDGDGDGDSGDGEGEGKGEKTQAEQDAERVAQARAEARKSRRQLAPWKAIGKDYGLTPEEVRARLDAAPKGAAKDDGNQVDAEQIRRDAERSVRERYNGQLVRSKAEALAADRLKDPDDARLIDLEDIDVDEQGRVDADEIRDRLDDLLDRKPHLAKSPEKRKTPKPDRSQGSTSREKATGRNSGPAGSLEDGAALYRRMTGKAS